MFFRAYLGWSLKHAAQNYLFISISFYYKIVCQNVSCEYGLRAVLPILQLLNRQNLKFYDHKQRGHTSTQLRPCYWNIQNSMTCLSANKLLPVLRWVNWLEIVNICSQVHCVQCTHEPGHKNWKRIFTVYDNTRAPRITFELLGKKGKNIDQNHPIF